MFGLFSALQSMRLPKKYSDYKNIRELNYEMPNSMGEAMKRAASHWISDKGRVWQPGAQQKNGSRLYSQLVSGAIGIAIGAGLAFFLDPAMGTKRRNIARDKAGSMMRRGSRDLADKSRYIAEKVSEIPQDVIHSEPIEQTVEAGRNFVEKVQTEVLSHLPYGHTNGNDDTTATKRESSDLQHIKKSQDAEEIISAVKGVGPPAQLDNEEGRPKARNTSHPA